MVTVFAVNIDWENQQFKATFEILRSLHFPKVK